MSAPHRPDRPDRPHRPRPYDEPHHESRPHSASIPLYLVLTIFTAGLFNLYWNYCQMRSCNELLERREFSFVWWLFLVILTFGLYHLYYQYKMGDAINEIQDRLELPVTEGLPVLSLVAAILGVGVVADCIQQAELNKIDEQVRF